LVPAFAFLGPMLLLAVMRAVPVKRALLGGAGGMLVVAAVQWGGVVPLPQPWTTFAAALLGPVLLIPYAIDRLLADRLGTWPLLLVFPTAQVTLEWLIYQVSLFASFGALAYTQAGWPLLLQLASVTGLWGISFLVALAGSAGAALLSEPRDWRPAGAFGGALGAALLFGGLRLAAAPDPTLPTTVNAVRVAGLAAKPADLSLIYATKAGCGSDRCASARADARSKFDAMLRRTEAAARKGAQLVVWSEVAGTIFADEEAAALARLSALAKQQRITVVGGLWIIRPGVKLWENKALLIGPDGRLLASYLKSRPVPGDLDVIGPGILPVVETALGRLALGICYDMDYPSLGRSADGAGLMLVPGSDWDAIDPLHPKMIALRAVENGYAVVRPSRQSRSVAFDAYGRLAGSADWQASAEPKVLAALSTQPVATFYHRSGDWFAFACVAALAGLALLGWLSPKGRLPKQSAATPSAAIT
jgi:apolipoprotein N-acyltransferase